MGTEVESRVWLPSSKLRYSRHSSAVSPPALFTPQALLRQQPDGTLQMC